MRRSIGSAGSSGLGLAEYEELLEEPETIEALEELEELLTEELLTGFETLLLKELLSGLEMTKLLEALLKELISVSGTLVSLEPLEELSIAELEMFKALEALKEPELCEELPSTYAAELWDEPFKLLEKSELFGSLEKTLLAIFTVLTLSEVSGALLQPAKLVHIITSDNAAAKNLDLLFIF